MDIDIRDDMKRLCGLMVLCIGVDMAIRVFIPTMLTLLIIIIGCLLLGYNLLCRY